jgi:hypothetical protein
MPTPILRGTIDVLRRTKWGKGTNHDNGETEIKPRLYGEHFSLLNICC